MEVYIEKAMKRSTQSTVKKTEELKMHQGGLFGGGGGGGWLYFRGDLLEFYGV